MCAVVSGTSTVAATATDDVGVVGVQFKIDGVNLGAEDTTAPYSVQWSTGAYSQGLHFLTAVARDASGNTTAAPAVYVTIQNDIAAPVVAVVAPAEGATVSGTVALAATASDNTGVAGVRFQIDGANFGAEDTTAPYSAQWNTATAANGSHSISAVARDATGNTTTSAVVGVTVFNDLEPPTIQITEPAEGTTVSGQTVTVTATATDNVGIAGVQIKIDGVNLGAEDVVSPYAVNWNTATSPDGGHSISAVARDAAGNVATASVSVNVLNIAAETLWPATATPASLTNPDATPIELGVKFVTAVPGHVLGVKFYKSPQNIGVHTGSLWNATGALIGTSPFAGESASGWQQVLFTAPIPVLAGATYTASYHTNVGKYSSTPSYFTTPRISGSLTAPASGNGTYKQGAASSFPTESYNQTNYWVDVLFVPLGADRTPPSVPTGLTVTPSWVR